MKTLSQMRESIDRFQLSFWDKSKVDHPPVGIACDGSFLPINYLRKKFNGTEIFPDDIDAELVMTDYEYISLNRQVFSDDWLPFSAAWRAVPWLEAVCGCPIRNLSGSLAPLHFLDSVEDLLKAEIPANTAWLDCLKRETEKLAASPPSDCWISLSILRGLSDIIAAMRGLEGFYYDLHDDIRSLDEAASRLNRLFIEALEMHFSIVSPHMNGYGHIFGYWAPDRTIVLQEDALGMCSQEIYGEVFRKYNAEIVSHLGQYVLFHLHSTGYQHYREVLQIPGIAGLELTIEANGPPLRELVPVLNEILEKSRLIIFVDHYFEDLSEVLRKIPHEGLYVLISDKFIQTEKEFRTFMKSNW